MDNLGVYIAVAAVLLIALFVARIVRGTRAAGDFVSRWCRENGVPDVPFSIEAAVRDVMAGTRPGISHNGEWWSASGIEQVGIPSTTRLLHEDTLPNEQSVRLSIDKMFEIYGGNAIMPPHLAEGRFVGTLLKVHPDIVLARITGRQRPIGAWLVAVPPYLIGSKK